MTVFRDDDQNRHFLLEWLSMLKAANTTLKLTFDIQSRPVDLWQQDRPRH